jgi:hypothetical protein
VHSCKVHQLCSREWLGWGGDLTQVLHDHQIMCRVEYGDAIVVVPGLAGQRGMVWCSMKDVEIEG